MCDKAELTPARPPCSVSLSGLVQARSLLKDAEGKNKLSKAEAKELESDLSHDINTQFGTRNENFALSVYERRSGTEASIARQSSSVVFNVCNAVQSIKLQ